MSLKQSTFLGRFNDPGVADLNVAIYPFVVARFALTVIKKNFGTAIATIIPIITIVAISSINENPDGQEFNFIIEFILAKFTLICQY